MTGIRPARCFDCRRPLVGETQPACELGANPRFHSVAGTSDATTLPDRSVDYVVAAQAFHWFEPIATRGEFARILQPGGWCVLMWNTRRLDSQVGQQRT